MNSHLRFILFLFISQYSFFNIEKVTAQGTLGGKEEYIIVKDYKPVLAESYKISDSPETDTVSSNPPALNYNIIPKRIETNFEAGVIKAVKLKDEPITKLYRSLVKLGIGNYATYQGELFVNSLRSKTGSLGLHLKHFSGSPNLNNVGDGAFSQNLGSLYGKYFLDHSTFSGDVNYNRDVLHYYGYDNTDGLIHLVNNSDNTKQRYNNFSMNFGLQSNYVTKNNLDYDFRFHFNTISDLYDVTENDFAISGFAGKMVDAHYFSLLASFDYFNKSMANFEKLSINSDLNRNIINLQPQVTIDQEDFHLLFGLGFGIEKNLSTIAHLFPKAEISIPIAEHVLTAYAGVDGNIVKNNFKTITDENPFIISSITPLNTINKLIISGGLKGNFSNTITFNAAVNYSQVKDLQLFYNDTIFSHNKFNVLYDDADVFNVHAEVSYMQSEKLNISLHVDQYKYSPDVELKAWHKPNSIVSIVAKYNLNDKVLADVSLFAHGPYYARTMDSTLVIAQKINGYVDANLGLEYRYSKILSFYIHLNNLGFSRYYEWNQYPSERFNVLGGLTYAF
jgi:hypothetical protein